MDSTEVVLSRSAIGREILAPEQMALYGLESQTTESMHHQYIIRIKQENQDDANERSRVT